MNSAFSTLESLPANASHRLEKFKEEVVEGLSSQPKRLPCKYFYDQVGSDLFDQICELDEYYVTRTELKIMEQFAGEMGQQIGEGAMLVEFGSGSSVKTRLLLEQLPELGAYVPVDISLEHLLSTAKGLSADYPHIEVLPVGADFTQPFDLPPSSKPIMHSVVYFPGSTIGNLEERKAVELLGGIAKLCGTGGGLLIGVDLQKDVDVLEAAYDDREGVTAAFNMNLLSRIESELDAELNIEGFEHHSFYNAQCGRIEIYLKSLRDQTVQIGDHEFDFQAGELVHTEYSHKYTIEGFAEIASRVGFTLRKSWTDPDNYFAILHLVLLGD